MMMPSVSDFGIWLADGVEGKEMTEGIFFFLQGQDYLFTNGDPLGPTCIKDMISRNPNRMYITTLEGSTFRH